MNSMCYVKKLQHEIILQGTTTHHELERSLRRSTLQLPLPLSYSLRPPMIDSLPWKPIEKSDPNIQKPQQVLKSNIRPLPYVLLSSSLFNLCFIIYEFESKLETQNIIRSTTFPQQLHIWDKTWIQSPPGSGSDRWSCIWAIASAHRRWQGCREAPTSRPLLGVGSLAWRWTAQELSFHRP